MGTVIGRGGTGISIGCAFALGDHKGGNFVTKLGGLGGRNSESVQRCFGSNQFGLTIDECAFCASRIVVCTVRVRSKIGCHRVKGPSDETCC